MKLCRISVFTTFLFIVVYLCGFSKATSHSHPQPFLYNVKHTKRSSRICDKSSPEVFFHSVAQPSLELLYHRAKALFGVLMDKIESSTSDSKAIEKTKEQWEFLSKTVTTSLDTAIHRLESEWAVLIILHDTSPLPWEVLLKSPLIHETVNRLEYSYLMVEAVIRSAVKEIFGTLQHQLADVIRNLEKEVSDLTIKNDEVTELKLLKQMKRGLSKMRPSFATKLLEKVIQKALGGTKPQTSNTAAKETTFVSESLDQIAIVVHAFREKSRSFPHFWNEMSRIFQKEVGYNASQIDFSEEVSKFVKQLLSDKDKLIDIVIQIISRDNKKEP